MSIIPRQVGWSQESNLLWELLKKLDRLNGVVSSGNNNTQITFAPSTSQDAFGRLKISEPYTLFDSSFRYGDNGQWNTLTQGTSATCLFNTYGGYMELTLNGPEPSDTLVKRETKKVFAYQPGKSLLVMCTFVMSSSSTAEIFQSVGYNLLEITGPYLQNGFRFEHVSSGDGTGANYFIHDSTSLPYGGAVVPQSQWNGDKLDGTGPSGLVLDPYAAQILWIDMEWLGVGSVRMGFVINGQFILCHTFNHANIVNATYMQTACLSINYEIRKSDSMPIEESIILKQICSTVISEGGYELRGAMNSIGTTITAPKLITNLADGFTPVIGLRLKQNRLNAIAVVTALSLLGTANNKNYNWRLVKGRILDADPGDWVSAGPLSPVEYNLLSTAYLPSSLSLEVLASGYFNSSNQSSTAINVLKGSLFAYQLERDNFNLVPFELILEVSVNDTTGSPAVHASVDWEEITR